MRRSLPTALFCLFVALAPVAQAQVSSFAEPDARGTAYFVYAEPGAPTVEIVMLGTGARNGIYRLQEGTTLVQVLALAGGAARSDSTSLGTSTSLVRVVREAGGSYNVIYESTLEELVLNRAAHPSLRTGDTIETFVDFEPAAEPGFTFRDGLEIASRVASLVSVVLLLATRL